MRDGPRDPQPGRVPAVERPRRVQSGLGLGGHLGLGHIGRVAHDDVHAALEVGACDKGVALSQVDPARGEVPPGPVGRRRVELDGGDGERAAPRLAPRRDGRGDRAGAGAQVHHDARRGPRGQVGHDGLHEQLGLRPRDEDARADRQVEPVEVRDTGQVLDGLAGGAASDERLERRRLRGLGHGTGEHPGQQRAAVEAEHVGQQQLGVHARRVDARRGQAGGGVAQQRGPGRCAHACPPSAASRRSSSRARQEAITASRSPSRTTSRLCAL